MPQTHSTLSAVCSNCAGFNTVVITTGNRLPDGTRETITVACPCTTAAARTSRTAVTR
ncbi:hypothetical protein H7827_13830 [Streptomyces sp. JH002]|uniref:hypothetical protein n=1 Tax=Streptomyces sp. JH002 TaxID=2763259 RepID=UPI003D8041EE